MHNKAAPTDAELDAIVAKLRTKYEEEKQKRLRPEGEAQFLDLRKSDGKLHHYVDDPWVASAEPPKDPPGSKCKYLIIGCGFAGILMAVRLIESGVKSEEIRMVDRANGFGGVWYWNRYPGVSCDIESYIYVPLLEEMDYMPKYKYTPGEEIRVFCEAVADKYQLRDKSFFRRDVKSLTWDEDSKEWIVFAESEGGKSPNGPAEMNLRAEFVLIAPGLTDRPKLSKLPGVESFKGQSMHSARWDYRLTGGSPEDHSLTSLKDKRVGIIGTGCSSAQFFPEVAKWAKEVYVFQRTPPTVFQRENRATDPEEYKTAVNSKKGWQHERMVNFAEMIHQKDPPPEKDLVNDEITHWDTSVAIVGKHGGIEMKDVPANMENLFRRDAILTEGIRAEAAEIVKDAETAEKLKAWYPSWCKRMIMHGGYLQSFNRPNVKLVDTDGKGVEAISESGVIANGGQEYPVDLLIFGTGYKVGESNMSPGARAGMKVTGRDGKDLDDMYVTCINTLHGVCAPGFPNMLWAGLCQAGISPNPTFVFDTMAKHFASILKTVREKSSNGRVTFEPTTETCDEWTKLIMAGGGAFAQLGSCPPSFQNKEGDLQREMMKGPEAQKRLMRGGVWGKGVLDYVRVLEQFRSDGMPGMTVEVVDAVKG